MSFQNSYGPDGSININVVPSFGRIVQLPEQQKHVTVNTLSFSFRKSMHGDPAREPFTSAPLTSTPLDMFPSVTRK